MARAALRVVRLLDEPEPQTFPIVKGIPLPKIQRRGTYARTLERLEVGDSFLCKNAGNVYVFAKKVGVKITVRRAPGGGWRVWRIA